MVPGFITADVIQVGFTNADLHHGNAPPSSPLSFACDSVWQFHLDLEGVAGVQDLSNNSVEQVKREDDVAGTRERTMSAMVNPNWPARSRSILIASVG